MQDQTHLLQAQVLRDLIAELYEKGGMSQEDAAFHAEGLVDASLRGVDSHGVMRTGPYFDRITNGAINVAPDVRQVGGDKALAILDGDRASGYIAGKRGMEKAMELARTYHLGMAFVKNSNHFGPAALYAQMAVDAGMVGYCATNVKPLITAPGAAGNVVGNNPFAVGIPTYGDFPFLLDLALSVVAGGKLKMAIKKGEKIPLDWAVDPQGNPTDDPQQGFDGYLLPVGGFKGLGMAYAIDILCGVLTGGAFQNHIKNMFKDPADPSETCHMFLALDVDVMLGREALKERMAEYRDYIRSIPTATGEPLCFPGEIEARTKAKRLAEGIPVPETVYRELRDLAAAHGLKTRI